MDIQRGILELMNVDPAWGVTQLETLSQEFPHDQEMFQKLQQFMLCAELACTYVSRVCGVSWR